MSYWRPITLLNTDYKITLKVIAKRIEHVLPSIIHPDQTGFMKGKTSSAAFYYLYNIRRIRKYLSKKCTETLIHAFISSRLDYCYCLLYGLPAYQIQKLQRVQNSAARFVFEESKFCHITPLLRALHWLPVAYRIVAYRIVFKSVNF